jgi:arginase
MGRPIELILVPYSLGREGWGMGAGPLALRADVEELLAPAAVTRLALSAPFENEVGACFDLNRQVAAAVAAARARGALPVVLTGNCHTQQAVVAGARPEGLVWFDCHGDLQTPETTTSGFFDGCALSMVLGHCWATLCASVPGFAPLEGERVVLVGGRDLEPAERERLAAADMVHVGEREVGGLGAALGAAGSRVSLHLDLDVLDAEAVGRANAYAMPGGIGSGELAEAVATVAGAAELEALTISAYDPSHDTDGGVRAAVRETLVAVRS